MPTLGRRAVLAAGLAAPMVARAQGAAKGGTVRIGMNTILSGPLALFGTSQRSAAQIEVARINAQGGLAGRTIELVIRDSKGDPDEATRVARALLQDGCEILIDAEQSAGAFAVQKVVRETGVLCMHSSSETSALTADPKLSAPTAFRTARQTVHDSIVGGRYAAAVAKRLNWSRWATCAPDYNLWPRYRDAVLRFLQADRAKRRDHSQDLAEARSGGLHRRDHHAAARSAERVLVAAICGRLGGAHRSG